MKVGDLVEIREPSFFYAEIGIIIRKLKPGEGDRPPGEGEPVYIVFTPEDLEYGQTGWFEAELRMISEV